MSSEESLGSTIHRSKARKERITESEHARSCAGDGRSDGSDSRSNSSADCTGSTDDDAPYVSSTRDDSRANGSNTCSYTYTGGDWDC